jgi:hypothetical protein
MGTDIHLFVEKYDGEKWVHVPPPLKELYKNHATGEPVMDHDWYFGRNYDLFALLADVRNGRGVAGIDTGDRITPIVEGLRPMPDDLSPEGRHWWLYGDSRESAATDTYHEGLGEDEAYDKCPVCSREFPGYHDFTWHTLRDLVSADYDQVQVKRGCVSPREFQQWRLHGRPTSWSGMVSGMSVRNISNKEMAAMVDIKAKPEDLPGGMFERVKPGEISYYTKVEWKHPLRDSMDEEWWGFLEALKEHTVDDGSDVRVLISFDS